MIAVMNAAIHHITATGKLEKIATNPPKHNEAVIIPELIIMSHTSGARIVLKILNVICKAASNIRFRSGAKISQIA